MNLNYNQSDHKLNLAVTNYSTFPNGQDARESTPTSASVNNSPPPEDKPLSDILFNFYFKSLVKYKIFILIFWLILTGVGVYFGLQLLSRTSFAFHAPPGTPSYNTYKILMQEFKSRATANQLIIFLHNKDTILSEEIKNFTFEVNKTMIETFPDVVSSVEGYYTFANYSYLLPVANIYKTDDNTSTLIAITCKQNPEFLNDFVTQANPLIYSMKIDDKYEKLITGLPALYKDVQNGMVTDLEKIDFISLPLCLLVVGISLKGIRLIIIPVINALCSMLVAFMIVYPATYFWTVLSITPSIMTSVVLAMSLDYSLFLLSRYREEIKKEQESIVAVHQAVLHAGRVIVVSGCTLAISFLGLSMFSMDIVKTIGIGSTVAILCCIATNMTITPSLLLLTDFFKYTLFGESIAKDVDNSDEAVLDRQNKSYWFRSASFFAKPIPAILITILISGLLIPVGIKLFDLGQTIDDSQLFPRASPSVSALERLTEFFSPGMVQTFFVTCYLETGIFNDNFFKLSQSVTYDLLSNDLVKQNAIYSISFSQSRQINFTEASFALDPSFPFFFELDEAKLYRYIYFRQTNPRNTTTLIEMRVEFNPYGDKAITWVPKVRDVLYAHQMAAQSITGLKGLRLELFGGGTEQVDAVSEVFKMFPYIIGITIGVIFFLMAIAFKSIFVPIRLLITLTIPISFVYGLAVYFFQEKIFGNPLPGMETIQHLYWIVPIMCFSILVGLAMDYDTFLFSRVYEYRLTGYSDRAAILKAIYHTGQIITSAGLIMAVAFGGLLFSSVMVLNQFSFFLVIAVLIDTFIVRTILVPAILSLIGPLNWWPASLIEPDKDENNMDDEKMLNHLEKLPVFDDLPPEQRPLLKNHV